MSDRLDAIATRMETVHQLGAVVGAMRGIAAARQHEAAARLDAIRAYAATVGNAIGEALALATGRTVSRDSGTAGHILILLCAEQGFAGTFSDRALDAARPLLQDMPGSAPAELMLAGSRGRMLAEAAGLRPGWSTTMPLHVREVPAIANRIAEALYERLTAGDVERVTLLHARPGGGAAPVFGIRALLPFDYARFSVEPRAIPPLVTIPAEDLLPMLAEEYVFAELCEALVQSFAAENEARLHAMMAVDENVRRTKDRLAASYRQRRQEAITEEVVELASGRVFSS